MQIETDRTAIALFVFAHQDDEVGAAPWIQTLLADGRRVTCVYLTDGGSRTPAHVRNRESLAVLHQLGVDQEDIVFLGGGACIPDGKLRLHIPEAMTAVEQWLAQHAYQPWAVYAPDWEGGHPDHDVCHVIAASIAAKFGVIDNSWGFPLYNAHKVAAPFFRALSPLPGGERRHLRYGLRKGFAYSALCFRYPSQLRTWIGLAPGFLVRRLLFRGETVRRMDIRRLTDVPHVGALLYERMFSTSRIEVLGATQDIVHCLLKMP